MLVFWRPVQAPTRILFVAGLLRDWETAEQRLGIDIDFRIFGIVKSSNPNLELALGVRPPSSNEEELATWRFGVLTSILWPRGAQVRSASLQIRNPFSETMSLIDCSFWQRSFLPPPKCPSPIRTGSIISPGR